MVSFRCPGEIFDPIGGQCDILIYLYPGSIKSIFSLSTTSSHPSHSRDTRPEMSSWPFPDLSLVITMSTLASDWSETQNVTVSVSLSSHSLSQWLPETLICSDIRYKRESALRVHHLPRWRVQPHFLCPYWPIRGQLWVPAANQRPGLIIVNTVRACWQIQETADSKLSNGKITNRLGIRNKQVWFCVDSVHYMKGKLWFSSPNPSSSAAIYPNTLTQK